MDKIKLIVFIVVLGLQFNGYSQEGFLYKRKINIKKDTLKWSSVEIPDDIYDKVKPDLSDIRIFSFTENDTVEVPYLLKIEPNFYFSNRLDGKIINKSSSDSKFYFTIEIYETNRVLNTIDLSFDNENFDWKIDLQGSYNQNEWFTILEDYRILAIKNAETDYRFEKLVFEDSKYKFYRISIETNQEPKLKDFFLYGEIQNEKNLFRTLSIKDFSSKNDKKNKQTIIEFSLKNKLPVHSLKLNVNDEFLYHRPIVIEYLSDSTKTEKGWIKHYKHFSSGIISSKEKTDFVCYTSLKYIVKDFRIIIDNQDNIPLSLNSVDINLLDHRLIFDRLAQTDLYLYYGNTESYKPLYDIEKYRSFLNETEIKPNTTLLDEILISKDETVQKPLFENKLWLWGMMILMIVILGYFSLKMISKKE